tara:strand:+ start:26377 stop:26604 length:228 start_codon:yes stop_codon:yes gene_type:complete
LWKFTFKGKVKVFQDLSHFKQNSFYFHFFFSLGVDVKQNLFHSLFVTGKNPKTRPAEPEQPKKERQKNERFRKKN